MKKRAYIIGMLFIIYTLQAFDRAFHITCEQMGINAKTEAIYYRYYLIKRLEVAMHLLLEPAVQANISVDQIVLDSCGHAAMYDVLEQMQEQKSIAPLDVAWQQFVSYQYIDDPSFNAAFIALMFSVYEQMVEKKDRAIGHVERMLADIDTITHKLAGYKLIEHSQRDQHITEVKTDQIAQCFLVSKRLEKTMQVLLYMHRRGGHTLHTKAQDTSFDLLMDELDRFDHQRVREAIIIMCKSKSLAPLLHLCAEYRQYRFASDDTFLKEMLMHIFLVYKSLLFKQLSVTTEQVIMTEMQQILDVYEHIEQMPLDETLEAIDMATDKLVAIQHMQAKGPSYMPWIASSAVLAACLSLFYWFQR